MTEGSAGAGPVVLGRDGREAGASVPKLTTGIPGFDHVAMGGLPRSRAAIVAGPVGSAKTVYLETLVAQIGHAVAAAGAQRLALAGRPGDRAAAASGT